MSAFRLAFVRHNAVPVRRATGLGNWAAAVHGVRVTSQLSHPVTWYVVVVPPVRRRHAAVHRESQWTWAIRRWPLSVSPSARQLCGCGSCTTACSLTLTNHRSSSSAQGTSSELPPTSRQLKSPAVTWSFLLDLNRWVSPVIPTSRSTDTPITSRGHATITLAPYVTYAVCWPMTWRRQWRAVSWHPGLTTATPCCTAHQQRPPLSCNGLRTTSPASSASVVAAQMQRRYWGHCTGCRWNTAARTRPRCWPTRCWRRPRRHISTTCWPSQRRPDRCALPALLCCSCRASVPS